jgi:signal transduction histidine kinase
MKLNLPFYAKLAITISLAGILVTGIFFFLAMWSSEKYHQEVTQKLHRDLANYVLDHLSAPLFARDAKGELSINKKVLKGIAMNTMMINPSVEVYLLDKEGDILGHALPEASVDSGQVDVNAIELWLDGRGNEAVLGDNPRITNERNIFSAAPVYFDGEQRGYLYIVLASHESASLANSIQSSHIARVLLSALLALVVFFILSAVLSFKKITNPLKNLAGEIDLYRKVEFSEKEFQSNKDEIEVLAHAFHLMRDRIQEQFDQLAESDRLRRELVSNVSHDLRTPLASMQGYLETLLIKDGALDPVTKKQYLEVAHRQSKHLATLVSQLFELSKLEAGKVQPEFEVFSLTELLFDVLQDYELSAQESGLSLQAQVPDENIMIKADISLMQRVLRNLIDNAFTHSQAKGEIKLSLEIVDSQVVVGVGDTGEGIAEEDIPYVFDRLYQSSSSTSNHTKKSGAGLGLNIVKRILDLHDSIISVSSEYQSGTEFSFALNREVSI